MTFDEARKVLFEEQKTIFLPGVGFWKWDGEDLSFSADGEEWFDHTYPTGQQPYKDRTDFEAIE